MCSRFGGDYIPRLFLQDWAGENYQRGYEYATKKALPAMEVLFLV